MHVTILIVGSNCFSNIALIIVMEMSSFYEFSLLD